MNHAETATLQRQASAVATNQFIKAMEKLVQPYYQNHASEAEVAAKAAELTAHLCDPKQLSQLPDLRWQRRFLETSILMGDAGYLKSVIKNQAQNRAQEIKQNSEMNRLRRREQKAFSRLTTILYLSHSILVTAAMASAAITILAIGAGTSEDVLLMKFCFEKAHLEWHSWLMIGLIWITKPLKKRFAPRRWETMTPQELTAAHPTFPPTAYLLTITTVPQMVLLIVLQSNWEMPLETLIPLSAGTILAAIILLHLLKPMFPASSRWTSKPKMNCLRSFRSRSRTDSQLLANNSQLASSPNNDAKSSNQASGSQRVMPREANMQIAAAF